MELLHLLNLFLIFAILLLIVINIYNYFYPTVREGATNMSDPSAPVTNQQYQDYGNLENNDPMFLAIKNAANISFIKTQLDDLQGIKQQIFDLSNNVYDNAEQIDQIQQAVQDQTEAITGGAIQDEEQENIADQEIIAENEEEPATEGTIMEPIASSETPEE
jgi:hypothetical protein